MRRTILSLVQSGAMATCVLVGSAASAQTTITTAGGTNYTGGNGVTGAAAVTFAVQNTNLTPINISAVQVFLNPLTVTSGTVCTLWASTVSLSGAPTISSPNWTSIVTTSPVTITTAQYYNVFNGISYTIPASTTVRFAVQSTAGITYSGAAGPPSPNTFSSGGVTLMSGGAQIAGLNVGYGGGFPSPANNPRWFTGSITFSLVGPCTDPPTAGTTVATVNPVCSGNTTVLSLTGGTSGTGQTYLWKEDGFNAPGANTGSTYTATITATHTYTCVVTCGLNSNTSSPLIVTLNTNAFPENFSSATFPPNCFTESADPNNYLLRGTPNGYAIAGNGSAQWNFFNAANGTTLTLSSPTFTALGSPMNLNFDVAGATYTGGEIDHIFLECSSDGGSSWPTLLANLDNNPTNGLLNPTHTTTTAVYAPTLAAHWVTLTYLLPAGTNRVRWRGVSNFGNMVYIDNLNLTAPPACLPPSTPVMSNITATTADATWTCPGCTGSYIVEYGLPGFIPGSAGVVGGGLGIVTTGSLSATITGLTGATQYEARVRQDCGGGTYSTNSSAISFITACGGSTCIYNFHLTDNYGDGWNNAIVQVRQNGATIATLGPQVLSCDASVNVTMCEFATYDLVCTAIGDFPDEPGITLTDPFNNVVYEKRGSTIYSQPATGGCTNLYPNPGVLSDMAVGTLFTFAGDCTPDPCLDPPTAGTINSSAPQACSGGTVDLTLTGGTLGLGQTYVWQSSPTGDPGSWTDIGMGNPPFVATVNDPTYYRAYVTCGANSDTSSTVFVDASALYCYCLPLHTPGCGNGNITNVALNTLNNTTTCNPPAYEAFPALGTTLQRGVSYNISVTTDQSCIISVWVDWDQDNLYEASEWTQVATSSAAGIGSVVALPVPLSATLGQTGMRVRSRFSGNPNGAGDACSSFGSGEGEDYVITVDPEPACLPASAIVFSNISATSFDVNWTNGANSCGSATYSIEYGPAGFVQGTGTTVGPFSGGPQTIAGVTAGTAYDVYVTRDCTPCGDGPGLSTLASVSTYPDCAAAQVINCPFGSGTFGPNGQGAWNFVEPLFNFTTVGAEQIFFLDATVLGTYTMSLTASVGSSIVAIYIKPVGSCDPAGWTYVATNQFTVQEFTFPIASVGQYWILVDPVSSSLPVADYLVSFVCPPQNIDCASAQALNCGEQFLSTTTGQANTLPPTACPYAVAPSTGGSLWYSYTGVANAEVTFSTCSPLSFDTRISVFTGPDCNNLTCTALNDDQTGCPNFSSEVKINALAGVTYYIAIHGFGADEGTFQFSAICGPECTPSAGNDHCPTASTLNNQLADGSETPQVFDNSCATVDFNLPCNQFAPMQGLWFDVTTGANTNYELNMELNAQNPVYDATTLSYVFFSGACDGDLGATSQSGACVQNVSGVQNLTLTPNNTYKLLVWNQGGVGFEGDFALTLTHPGMNDAGIDSVLEPSAFLCSSLITPVVRLHNYGELALTSVYITYDVDGGTPQVYLWNGNLASGATEDVTLPDILSSPGSHTLNVSTSLPNTVADEIPGNDGTSRAVDINGEAVEVIIHTDNNGGQTSWIIVDAFALTVASGGPYTGQNNVDISTVACLPTTVGNCYGFYILDDFGDGICCANGNGFWELHSLNGRLLLRDNGEFTSLSPTNPPVSPGYVLGHEFCLPYGPSAIETGECNVFTNTLLSKVYTTEVTGVTNYQFEFSNPDAGHRRRITLPRRWVKFGEMVSNPLLPGVTYFARARADVGNDGMSNDHFGPGCEMGIDPSAVPGCTGLIDNNSLPTHSCGVTKTFGGSDKIWAQPVVNGTQYRFNFSNTGEGYNRNILRPSYVCLLSWVTNPLVNGSTYDVKVEVLVNGAWSGFCGPICQVTINNPPAQGGVQHAMAAGTNSAEAGFSIFPNPVHDNNLTLVLNTELGSGNVEVELYDLFGKRVLSTSYAHEGGTFQQSITLTKDVSPGTYLVKVVADGHEYLERVTVL